MEKKVRVIKNEDINRLIMSRPKGGELNIVIETKDDVIVLSHVTVSNISRAFHWINGHPRLEALEMKLKKLAPHERIEGFPDWHFEETERVETEIHKDVAAWIAESRRII